MTETTAQVGEESAIAEGSETTPEQDPTNKPDPIALARKRQAGAEAARQKAQEERDAALKELEAYRSKERSAEDQNLQDNAKLQERLAKTEKERDEAKAEARREVLDFKYPNARAKLPEITDEVRLAEFEALFGDSEGDDDLPTPQNPNESNRAAKGDATAKTKEETSDDIKARLKALGKPDWA